MKKILFTAFLAGLLTALFSAAAYAATATVDDANSAKGYVTVTLADYKGKEVKAQVIKGDNKYQYTLINEKTNLPLQMGTGDYTIQVIEMMGDKGKSIGSLKLSVTSIDEKAMYTVSIPQIDFGSSTKAIPAYKKLTESSDSVKDKSNTVYESVVTNFVYDYDLMEKVINKTIKEYVPVIDTVYDLKKGICYGYAAVFGGALRSLGIPTRMVQGYTPEKPNEFHAWNEVFLDGKWIAVDTTFDAVFAHANQPYTFERDRSKAKITKIY